MEAKEEAAKAAKETPKRGGAREGSGRKARYAEPLSEVFTVRFNEEQGQAIGAWCAKRKISPVTLIREASLVAIGAAHLGLGGVGELRGTSEREVGLAGAATLPVRATERQARAIRAHCEKKGIKVASWMREAVLKAIGREGLGIHGEVKRLEKAIK